MYCQATRYLMLAGVAWATLSPQVHAAEAGASASDGEIIVNGERQRAYSLQKTASGSKTDTPLRDLPASVVVISAQVLLDQGAQTMDDALTNASAVAPSFAGGYGLADMYVIRGLAMRFLRDGLPDGPTFMGYRRSLADVQAIEVLKGPGSALYGRAEAGGSVNIATKQPLDRFAVEAMASYSRFDNWEVTGDVSAPLSTGIAGRLIGHHEQTDGYRGLKRRITEVLPTLSLKLGERNSLTIDYDYRDAHNVVDNFGIPFTIQRQIASVDPSSRIYSPFNSVDQTIHRVTVKDEHQATDDLKLRAAMIYDKRDIAVARDGGANLLDTTTNLITGRNGRTQFDDAEYWTGQVEAVLTPKTGSIAHTILLGTEYSHTDVFTVRRNYNLGNILFTNGVPSVPNTTIPTTTTLSFDRRILSSSLSVYGQEQMDISGGLKLRAGFRYDSVKLEDLNRVGVTAASRRGTRGLFSWQVGAVYQPSDWLSIYAGYSKGEFVSIQTESATLSPVPEASSQVEAGVKGTFLNGALNVNVAAFETKRDNYFITLSPGADPVQEGSQRSRGVEADLIGAPAKGLTFIANFAYVDALNRASALGSVAGLATNQSIYGKRLGSTPETSGSFWTNYTLVDGPLAGFGIGAGLVYKGSTYVDALELLEVPSYTVYRASLTYRTPHYEVQLTVNNITDKTYYSTPTFIGALPGDPRTFKLSVRTRF